MAEIQHPIISRPLYIQVLKTNIDVPLVKILAGIRRSGKSTILEIFKQELLSSGISADRIIRRRYTSLDIPDNFSARDMYENLKQAMQKGGRS